MFSKKYPPILGGVPPLNLGFLCPGGSKSAFPPPFWPLWGKTTIFFGNDLTHIYLLYKGSKTRFWPLKVHFGPPKHWNAHFDPQKRGFEALQLWTLSIQFKKKMKNFTVFHTFSKSGLFQSLIFSIIYMIPLNVFYENPYKRPRNAFICILLKTS